MSNMNKWLLAGSLILLIAPQSLFAQNYNIAKGKAPVPTEVADSIRKLVDDTVYKIDAGGKTIAEIWLLKEFSVDPNFKPTPVVLYPFQIGSIVGVLRYPE